MVVASALVSGAQAQMQIIPFVDGVTPNSGSVAGGERIVIKVDAHGREVTDIFFGTKRANIISKTNPTEGITVYTMVTVTAPPGDAPGKVNVTARTDWGTSPIPGNSDVTDYTYRAAQQQGGNNNVNNAPGNAARDPLNDPQVRALVSAQASALRRVTSTSMDAVHRRLEMLHEDDVPDVVNGLSVSGNSYSTPSDVRFYEDPLMRNATTGLAAQAINRNAEMPRMKPAQQTKPPQPLQEAPYKIWVSGNLFFGGGQGNTMSGAGKIKYALSGIAAGFDMDLMPDLKGGFAVNIGDDNADLGTEGGRIANRNIGGSLYGSWRVASGIHLDGTMGYGYLTTTSRRVDTIAPAIYSGDRSGHGFNGSLALSYDYKYDAVKLATYLRADATYATLGSYTETGGANALSFNSASVTGQSMALGMRGEYPLEQEWGTLVPFGRAEYRRLFSGALNQTMSYTDTPGTTYQLANASFDKDVLMGSLGLEARAGRDLSARMEYLVTGGVGGLHGQGLRGSLRLGF
jgi:outer membrane autotransporter protein